MPQAKEIQSDEIIDNFPLIFYNFCMGKPFLSIITINYNNAEGLRKTMQSVFDLTFTDYEYIIIDGASTDESVTVIKDFLAIPEYAAKISFWCTEPDKGIYNAMNKGLLHVNGKLVIMMNSGDCFIKDSLEKLPLWEKENPHCVLHGAISKYKNGVFVGCEGQTSLDIDNTPLCHQATFVPVELHEKYGVYDDQYKIYGDFEFWNRLKKNGVSFAWINQIICNFDDTGVSSVVTEARWKEKEIIQKKYGTYVAPSFLSKCKKLIKIVLNIITNKQTNKQTNKR